MENYTPRLQPHTSRVSPTDTPQPINDICQFNGKRVKGGGGKRKKGQSTNSNYDSDSLFMHHYRQWYTSYYGSDLKVPKFNKQELNLEDLWKAVMQRGGSRETSNDKLWAEIGRQFNPPKSMTNLSFHIKRIFEKYLLAYEKSMSPSTAMEWRHAPVQSHLTANTCLNTVPPNTATPTPTPTAPIATGSSGELEYGSSFNSDRPVLKKMVLDQRQNAQEFIAQVCVGDEPLVGSIIRLWISVKQSYESVKIVGYCPEKHLHTVRFSNGVMNTIKLKEHTWSVCSEDRDNAASQQEQPQQCAQSAQMDTAKSRWAEDMQQVQGEQQGGGNLFSEALPRSACELVSLVYNSQAELEQAQTRIEELELREKLLQEELASMKLQYHAREQQLKIMLTELTQKLKESNEARQLAEGAVRELRHCFEFIVNGNVNANVADTPRNNEQY